MPIGISSITFIEEEASSSSLEWDNVFVEGDDEDEEDEDEEDDDEDDDADNDDDSSEGVCVSFTCFSSDATEVAIDERGA